MSESTGFTGKRIADEAIYDNLSYYDEPKEYFKLVLGELEKEIPGPGSLLDIGAANGAFLNHARARFPKAQMKGLEPVASLAEIAKKNLAGAKIWQGGLFDTQLDGEVGESTIVALLGVLGIFFDPEAVVKRLLALTSPGGAAVIFSPFNEEAIDVLMNYRRAPKGEWESGHNLYSKKTMESICAAEGAATRWVDFAISKPIAKTDDPMRSWTEPFRNNKHQLVYGTNMFATMKLLVIRKR